MDPSSKFTLDELKEAVKIFTELKRDLSECFGKEQMVSELATHITTLRNMIKEGQYVVI